MGEVAARAHQELDPDERLLIVCHHGIRSMNVAVWLRNQGFEQAQSVRAASAPGRRKWIPRSPGTDFKRLRFGTGRHPHVLYSLLSDFEGSFSTCLHPP